MNYRVNNKREERSIEENRVKEEGLKNYHRNNVGISTASSINRREIMNNEFYTHVYNRDNN